MAMTEIAQFGFRLPQFPILSNCIPNLSIRGKNVSFRVFASSPSSITNETGQVGSSSVNVVKFSEDENRLIEAIIGVQGRGRSASPQQLKEVERAVQVLEELKGVSDPTSSDLIEGRWRLMFTTRPGSASPIQRTFVGVDFFSVFQEVFLRTDEPRVSNIVKFSDAIGELKVEAVASVKDGKRILFRFDRAAFAFKFLPFKVPYPVPFKLLGDEAKGWLDTTYLSDSGNIRISRGNKGTTFVLQKETEPRQQLLSAISTGNGVPEAMDKLISATQYEDEEPQLLVGEWRMIWSSQVETDSWLENAGNGLMGNQVIKGDGQLRFLVDIVLGLRFSMSGTYQYFLLSLYFFNSLVYIMIPVHKVFKKTGPKKYDVKMDDAAIVAGSFGLPIEMLSKFNLDLLYSDDKLRITRGYNNIMFVHLRAE